MESIRKPLERKYGRSGQAEGAVACVRDTKREMWARSKGNIAHRWPGGMVRAFRLAREVLLNLTEKKPAWLPPRRCTMRRPLTCLALALTVLVGTATLAGAQVPSYPYPPPFPPPGPGGQLGRGAIPVFQLRSFQSGEFLYT